MMPAEEPLSLPPVKIEPATLDDISAIQSIAAESWRAAYSGFMAKPEMNDDEHLYLWKEL